ncbi:acyl carrier protein [Euzebya tangerina]|uniref:acyl carrier protein n=1 Tax=Euzebya tangerina TaxID=591198 RepID=UPI0013C2BE20|nr:acyl carrier protein [Euzebya tangerina]
MSDQPSTSDRIAAVIDDLFGVPADALTSDVTLQDGLQLDSLSVVELQVAVEDELDIRFDEASTAEVATFGDLVAAARAMLQRAGAEPEPTSGSDRKAS